MSLEEFLGVCLPIVSQLCATHGEKKMTLPARAWGERGLLLGSVLLLLCGCGPKQAPVVEPPPLSQLLRLYVRYMGHNRGQGPSSETVFRRYIRTMSPADLQSLGLKPTELERLFHSPRDQQPYVVLYKQRIGGKSILVIHERVGVAGKRLVGLQNGEVKEVDDTELLRLLSGS